MLAINDGSTDRSIEIIKSFKDKRVKIIDNDTNKGLIYTLNKGLELASGTFIARMDADDIMLPDRLKKQYLYLQSHPEIDICGCFIEIFCNKSTIGSQIYGVDNDHIKAELLFNSPLAHPTYFIRKSAMNGYKYNSDYKYCEDYEFLSRFLLENHQASNLSEVLLKYRISNNSQTSTGEADSCCRYTSISKIQSYILKHGLGFHVDEDMLRLHYCLSLNDRIKNMSLDEFSVKKIKEYFNQLCLLNQKSAYCSKQALNLSLGKIWLKLIRYKSTVYKRKIPQLVLSRYTLWGIKFLLLHYKHNFR